MPRPVKYVEIGRVAYAINGPAKGKLLAIVDIIDYNRVLVDGPSTGVSRQEYRLTQLQLTGLKIKIQHSQRSRFVRAAWKEAGINALWKKSQFAQNLLQAKKRKRTTDYDRFRIARLKQRRSQIVSETLKSMQKYSNARIAARPKIALAAKVAAYKKQQQKAKRIAKCGGPEAFLKMLKEKAEQRKLKLAKLAKKKAEFNEKMKKIASERKEKYKARKASRKPGTKVENHRQSRKKLSLVFKTDKDGKFIKTYKNKLVKIVPDPVDPAKAIKRRRDRIHAKLVKDTEDNKQKKKRLTSHARRHILQKAGLIGPKAKSTKKPLTKEGRELKEKMKKEIKKKERSVMGPKVKTTQKSVEFKGRRVFKASSPPVADMKPIKRGPKTRAIIEKIAARKEAGKARALAKAK